MSITCKICNTEFQRIIPWQHLRDHAVSTAEYKKQFGDVYSPETLDKLSKRVPHNKGQKVTDPAVLLNIAAAVQAREKRFRAGEIKRGVNWSDEQKEHLSLKTKEFAAMHPTAIKNRAAKAIQTKVSTGYDFGGNMRGKTHSVDTKAILQNAARINNVRKSARSHEQILHKINELSLTLLSDISLSTLELQCNICNTHFSFTKQYFQPAKFKESLCPTCYPRNKPYSKKEMEMFDFIKAIAPDAIHSYRPHYHDKELDVFVANKNIGFEFNGLYWHSEQTLLANNSSATADYEKQQLFSKQGIRVVQIFEDEWDNKQEIVKSRIHNILNNTPTRVYARKCEVREISSSIASEFITRTHIMGTGRSNIRFGLYHCNTLVSVMTFSNSNISRKINNQWEINRFSSELNTTVVGGASKLFAAFIKEVNPESVISYADNRWSTGALYKNLGFVHVSAGTPNYWYTKPNTTLRIHRFRLRKNKTDNQHLSENENRFAQGFLRIWDSGSSKWLWSKTLC